MVVPLIIVLVGAWSYRWVQEDAFINFRIIGNLVAGHGPVFNVGERVEAYSDPLWLFLVAGAHEVVPSVSLGWVSVVLGLAGTAIGVVLAGRGIQRLAGRRDGDLVLPIGLLIFSVVAGVWEFATSGLEMGLTFCWIGLGFWLLVRVEKRRRGAVLTAFVLGLGTLIRPELLLMSIVFLAALAVVVAAPGWTGPTGVFRRYVAPVAAATALPVLYEVWRMAYFALVVSNTALAKSAGASWWSQGFTYVWNFVSPYTLWVPIVLAVPLVALTARRWWRNGNRSATVVLMAPIAASLADLAYVARVGGDYQHARLLLPGFLALCLPIYVPVRRLRSLLVVPVLGIVAWSVVCGGWLRYSTGNLYRTDHGIGDERRIGQATSNTRHPIDADDYLDRIGTSYRALAARAGAHGRQVMMVSNDLRSSLPQHLGLRTVHSSLPFHLVTNVGAVGAIGLLSGPGTYIFDSYSLANPIGSHFTVSHHGRPGHEKYVSPAWMVGRFGSPGTTPPARISARSVTSARRAVTCAPLDDYLHAITAPMSFSRAISNITHAFTYTSMSFSPQPVLAEHQLCG